MSSTDRYVSKIGSSSNAGDYHGPRSPPPFTLKTMPLGEANGYDVTHNAKCEKSTNTNITTKRDNKRQKYIYPSDYVYNVVTYWLLAGNGCEKQRTGRNGAHWAYDLWITPDW